MIRNKATCRDHKHTFFPSFAIHLHIHPTTDIIAFLHSQADRENEFFLNFFSKDRSDQFGVLLNARKVGKNCDLREYRIKKIYLRIKIKILKVVKRSQKKLYVNA